MLSKQAVDETAEGQDEVEQEHEEQGEDGRDGREGDSTIFEVAESPVLCVHPEDRQLAVLEEGRSAVETEQTGRGGEEGRGGESNLLAPTMTRSKRESQSSV
eukprot:766867-Hanusia_phi.AAC.2